MERIEYKIVISAPAKTVWETMLQEETYTQWVGKSWPNSFYKGKWAKGEKISFIGPDGSGTLAELVEVRPYESLLARHVAILRPGGEEDRTSEVARGWIGITEGYNFTERDGNTTLTVAIETTPEWRAMFDEGWPAALQELKKISERQMTTA
ncbi:MAG TPA: SRPBCC domain-containing protein [Chryseosolibacter sp.]|nr:SRPBCC domain-containing protein [Chryseosolibacter sp.]